MRHVLNREDGQGVQDLEVIGAPSILSGDEEVAKCTQTLEMFCDGDWMGCFAEETGALS